jgi:hypothetical protein
VYAIKTDCIIFDGDEKIIKNNFDMTDKTGNYRIEYDKNVNDNKLNVNENK